MNMKSSQESELRRHQDNLVTIGSGVVTVGVVSMLQLILYFYVNLSEIRNLMPAEENDTYLNFVMAITFGMALIGMLMRAYIGFSARAEGKGRKRGFFYVVLAGLIALLDVCLTVFGLIQLADPTVFALDMFVTVVFFTVSVITIVQMMVSAVYVKRASKQVK